MTKRIISAIVIFALLLSASAVAAFAYDPDPEYIMKEKCIDAMMKKFDVAEEYRDEVYIDFAVSYDRFIVFQGTVGPCPDLCTHCYIDGYWFFGGAIFGSEDENPVGLYALDNYGNLRTLEETANMSFIDMDGLFEVMPEKGDMFMRGDIDNDRRLTVKDATFVQKYVAGFPETVEKAYKHLLGARVMDFDLSGGTSLFGSTPGISVKDATAIQKRVAGLDVEFNSQPFEINTVLICIEGKDIKEYTPDDFYEIDVEKVEQDKLGLTDKTQLILWLSNPSKDTVIDAVNALQQRVGSEFTKVTPNYIATAD